MASATPALASTSARPHPRIGRDGWVMRGMLALVALFLLVALVLPLYAILSRSFQHADGAFAGLDNYVAYFASPALSGSIWNSFYISIISTTITVSLAFVYAYAVTRTMMPARLLFRGIAMVPILAPSLLSGISLVYLFGNQGMIRELLMGESIYGPIGIIMGEVYWTFPHAFIIITTSLALTDARLYEAAKTLGASATRTFFTVTLPGARYGLVSAFCAVFSLVITDFGVPKVIGGQYDVLATDVYKQVVGQQNFEMGAVVGMILLLPALVTFTADRIVQRRQVATMSARAVPYRPSRNRRLDLSMLAFCIVLSVAILGIIAVAAYASFVSFWPYNLNLSLKNYQFDLMDGGGWDAYFNSLEMAAWTAVAGTALVFTGAYAVEKTQGARRLRSLVHLGCIMPVAVPGLVLGLAYIFFFNDPANPFNFLYQTMAILVICTIAHYYTVGHLTATTALKQLDPEFESVSLSLKVPQHRTFLRVTVPVCMPAILDISIYYFVNAMTTVSAVVFIYSADTALASVAVLNMDDAGDIAPAAAMAMMIVYTSATVRVLHALLTRGIARSTQAWRAP